MGRAQTVRPGSGVYERQWMGRVQTARPGSKIDQRQCRMDRLNGSQSEIRGGPIVRPTCVISWRVFIMVLTRSGLGF